MKEKLAYFPFQFIGTTCAATGTVQIAAPFGLSFRYAGVFVPTDCGATVTITSVATGQGTATIPLNTQAAGGGGSVWFGSAATNAGTVGTVLNDLFIPKGGTVHIVGSAGSDAGTATVMTGYVAFALAEA